MKWSLCFRFPWIQERQLLLSHHDHLQNQYHQQPKAQRRYQPTITTTSAQRATQLGISDLQSKMSSLPPSPSFTAISLQSAPGEAVTQKNYNP